MLTDREIVVTLARDVMGWSVRFPQHDYIEFSRPDKHSMDYWAACRGGDGLSWNPLESWADAGMVLKQLVALGVRYDCGYGFAGYYWCRLFTKQNVALGAMHESKSPTRAISLAAYEWAVLRSERQGSVPAGEGKDAE